MDLLRNLLPRAKPPAVPLIPTALPQGMRIGPWRVVRPLGGGGNGAVYREGSLPASYLQGVSAGTLPIQ